MDIVGEAVEGVGGFVGVGTVVGALARLDHHEVLAEGFAVGAAELDPDGPRGEGAAAAAVHAAAARPGPVLLQAGAVGVGELDWLAGLLGPAALLSFLFRTEEEEEGSLSVTHQNHEETRCCYCLWGFHFVVAMVIEAHLETGVGGLGAGPHFTDPRLFDQFAFTVVVGDSGGDAGPTGRGALGPGCGLDDALLAVEHLAFRLHSERFRRGRK